MKKINLFFIGFPKSGTTSIADALSVHPEICFSKPKEPDIFLKDEIDSKLIDFHFEDYTSQRYIAEGSQRYTINKRWPNVAEKIYNYNCDAKFIVVARSPIKRMKSQFKMFDRDVDLGCTINDSFKVDFLRNTIIETSRYKYQVDQYLNYFPIENFYFGWFEEFIENQQNMLNSIYSFLKLDYIDYKESIKLNSAKKTGRTTALYRSLNKLSIYNKLKKLFPIAIRDKYREYLKIKFFSSRKYRMNNKFCLQFRNFIIEDLNQYLDMTNAPEKIRELYLSEMRDGLQQEKC